MRALLSVSNKNGIIEFARELELLRWDIFSTGGTYELLIKNKIKASKVEDLTNFPECFEGRIKTLNPYIHGGILYKRKSEIHIKEKKELNIKSIDLVCVNLYPFQETINKTEDFNKIIENIDIGGPAMLRSSAKNFQDVLVVSRVNDYKKIINAIKKKQDNIDFRRELMIKAFEHTAFYDGIIANYMNNRFNKGFGEYQFIMGKKVLNTRYGENPHQNGCLYEFNDFFSKNFIHIKGEPSFNNLTDIDSAIKIAISFKNKNSICIVKHSNPCGFAVKDTLLESYSEAIKCDSLSSFGGVVAVNGVVTKELAEEMNKTFFEVIIAGDFEEDAIKVFSIKKRIKLFSQGKKRLSLPLDKFNFKNISGGFLFQNKDEITKNEVINSKLKSKRKATSQEIIDLEIAWKISSLTKSNSIVYVKNSVMLAVGMGMTSRVDSVDSALRKAKNMKINLYGSVMASEAFFPFRDSIDMASKSGVKAIIEPGGSIRDNEIIESANEHNISLYFSGVRHFLH